MAGEVPGERMTLLLFDHRCPQESPLTQCEPVAPGVCGEEALELVAHFVKGRHLVCRMPLREEHVALLGVGKELWHVEAPDRGRPCRPCIASLIRSTSTTSVVLAYR